MQQDLQQGKAALNSEANKGTHQCPPCPVSNITLVLIPGAGARCLQAAAGPLQPRGQWLRAAASPGVEEKQHGHTVSVH